MTKPLISLRDVSVDRAKRRILSDITLDVLPGEVLALVGPNGAGKSTLLSTLSGEVVPTLGDAAIGGKPSRDYKPKELARLRSVLLQSNEVSFPFRVSQVVAMGRNPWAGTDEEANDDARVSDAMEQVGIAHLADRRFSELSGGERARVSLARVLAQDTDVMLLDEPTAALDLHHQDRVMQLVKSRAQGNRAVVVVVHDVSLAAAYADRIALIVEGRISALGSAADVLTREKLQAVYDVELHVIESPDGHPLVVPVRNQA
jgi:iron complex transport system ATP-binding protein